MYNKDKESENYVPFLISFADETGPVYIEAVNARGEILAQKTLKAKTVSFLKEMGIGADWDDKREYFEPNQKFVDIPKELSFFVKKSTENGAVTFVLSYDVYMTAEERKAEQERAKAEKARAANYRPNNQRREYRDNRETRDTRDNRDTRGYQGKKPYGIKKEKKPYEPRLGNSMNMPEMRKEE